MRIGGAGRWAAVFSVLLLAACGGGGDGSDTAALSGAITAPAFSHLDGDTNNPVDPLRANDSRADAQPLANPAVVAGYLRADDHVRSAGESVDPDARFLNETDSDDWYSVTLAEGQAVNLVINGTTASTDFDLFLIDATTSMQVASSMNVNDPDEDGGDIETLEAPSDGDFLVNVSAVAGAGNYVLRLGSGVEALQLDTLRVEADFVPGQVVARYRDRLGPAARGSGSSGGRARLYEVPVGGGLTSQARRGSAIAREPRFASEKALRKYRTIQHVKALKRDPEVLWASLNHRVKPLLVPDDPRFGEQENLTLLGFPEAWEDVRGFSRADVVVAVVDTGVIPHPDLDANLNAADGYDFVQADGGIDSDPTDPDPSGVYHGTHVAGTLGAVTNNDLFIAGAAGPSGRVRLMIVRALGLGGGTEYDVLQGVRYAAGLENDSGRLPANTANVINLSLGGGGGQFETAFREVRDQAGVILVAAAGNEGVDRVNVPAIYDGVIAVGALDEAGTSRADFSNFGVGLDVMAPGTRVLGLGLNAESAPDAVLLSGTSTATPHVSAVAALMKSVWPAMTPDDFYCALISGALTGSDIRDDDRGYGVIDAALAVSNAVTYRSDPTQLSGGIVTRPQSLDFGNLLDALTLTVTIPCDSGASIVDIQASEAWLRIEDRSGARGIGDYRVIADRAAMPEGVSARGAVTITATSGVEPVTADVVALTAPAGNFAADAGTLYVQLVDLTDDAESREQRLQPGPGGGRYQFRFEGVPDGDYAIVAGTDRDYDFAINDPGEAYGAYPQAGVIRRITVGGGNLGGLDFELGYRGQLNTQGERVERAATPHGGGNERHVSRGIDARGDGGLYRSR